MKKAKNYFLCALAFAMMFALCSCSTFLSYSFNVETGDKIKVTLDTSSGLSLEQKDGVFSVKKDDEVILQGMFINEATYNQYVKIKGQQGMTVLADTEKDGNTYYMYEVDGQAGTEDNFVVWLKNSNTGVILGSVAGKDNAKEAFEKLTLEKE